MVVKLMTEHHLEFLSLKGGCRGLSESTLVKMLEILCHGSLIKIYVFVFLYVWLIINEIIRCGLIVTA